MKASALGAVLVLALSCGQAQPSLEVEGVAGSVARTVVEGGPNPLPQTLVLHNTGTCALAFAVETATVDGAAWLAATPQSGNIAQGGSAGLDVAFDVTTPALRGATYTGTVFVTATCVATGREAVGSPAFLPINLTVTEP